MSPLGDAWEGMRAGFGSDLSPDAEAVLKRTFFRGAAAALALHGGVDLAAQDLVRNSLHCLETEVSGVLDAGE